MLITAAAFAVLLAALVTGSGWLLLAGAILGLIAWRTS